MANYINSDSSVSMRQSQCALLSRDVYCPNLDQSDLKNRSGNHSNGIREAYSN